MSNQYLSFKQVAALIKAVGHKRTVIVKGENGSGKTALHAHLCNDPQFENHNKIKPIECTQMNDGSMFMPDIDREAGVSRELPNERMGVSKFNQRGVNGSRPVLGMFDEIAKVPQFVKNMIAPLLYERRVGPYALPEGSVWFAATNLAFEGLGDTMQAHLRNRLVIVSMRKAYMAEWMNDFAVPNKLHPVLLACCEEHPMVFDSFIDYLPGGKFEGRSVEKDNPHIFNPAIAQDAYASLRSLHAASDVLYGADECGLDSDTLRLALEGTVGVSFTSVLMSFIRFGQMLPPISQVKANPDTVALPSSKIAQQVQVFQLINRTADRDDAAAFTKYIKRLHPEIQQLFVRRVSESSMVGTFATVTEFGQMLADNRIYFKV